MAGGGGGGRPVVWLRLAAGDADTSPPPHQLLSPYYSGFKTLTYTHMLSPCLTTLYCIHTSCTLYSKMYPLLLAVIYYINSILASHIASCLCPSLSLCSYPFITRCVLLALSQTSLLTLHSLPLPLPYILSLYLCLYPYFALPLAFILT